MPKVTKLHINGKFYRVDVDAETSLLSVLRDQLDLTGSKYGCGEGMCGACTVLLDGEMHRSCITPVGAAAAKKISTIEGVAESNHLHPLQQAFLDKQALQCGYCTSGMIMSAAALLRAHPEPSEDQIREFMQGNVCRCGTYARIVKAIQQAAAAINKSGA